MHGTGISERQKIVRKRKKEEEKVTQSVSQSTKMFGAAGSGSIFLTVNHCMDS